MLTNLILVRWRVRNEQIEYIHNKDYFTLDDKTYQYFNISDSVQLESSFKWCFLGRRFWLATLDRISINKKFYTKFRYHVDEVLLLLSGFEFGVDGMFFSSLTFICWNVSFINNDYIISVSRDSKLIKARSCLFELQCAYDIKRISTRSCIKRFPLVRDILRMFS